MTSLPPNVAAAFAIVDALAGAGVRHAVLSPGGRSAPLALAVAQSEAVRDWIALDERSAGFFALGMARRLGEPVAVLCTSGTAAANLLPAIAEASQSRAPLVIMTADRPPELRGFGAAQTIDQVDLYGRHVRWSADAPPPTGDVDLVRYYRALASRAVAVARCAPAGPVHLNLPLREPLVPADAWPSRPAMAGAAAVRIVEARGEAPAAALDELAERLAAEEQGVVVCGPLAEVEGVTADLAALASRLGWPLLADPLSGARFDPRTRDAQADAYDLLLRDVDFASSHRSRAVLRFGGVPVSKALGALLAEGAPTHAVVAPPGDWPDPWHVATDILHAGAPSVVSGLLARVRPRSGGTWHRTWMAASRAVRRAIEARLAGEEELFEGKVAAELIEWLPDGALFHVGNSMPVRDLDTFGAAGERRLQIACNRGVNGIDGVLSTALGAAAVSREPVVLLVGDVSFLHDVGALHLASTLDVDATVVVTNNDGGGVFSFLPHARYGAISERVFGTPHGLHPSAIAASFGARAQVATDWASFRCALEGAVGRRGLDVIEVPSDRARNPALHQSYVDTAREALRACSAGTSPEARAHEEPARVA
jgi:2-succinyl-5-enolpyruvyl-6-hydroxy-3-cyclohexene-1-carboxylate synthase